MARFRNGIRGVTVSLKRLNAENHTDRAATGSETTVSDDSNLTEDDLFDILSNRRRRYTLQYLSSHAGTARLGPLAERIAARENDVPIETVTSTERKRVYTALQQFHLPKMDRKGIVEYDGRDGTVELTASGTLDSRLDGVSGHGVPWSRYYVAVSVLGLVTSGVSALEVTPLAAIPSAVWATFTVVAIALAAIVHAISEHHRRSRDD